MLHLAIFRIRYHAPEVYDDLRGVNVYFRNDLLRMKIENMTLNYVLTSLVPLSENVKLAYS